MKLGKPHNCKCLGMKISVASRNSLNICQQEHSMASPQHFTVLSTFSATFQSPNMILEKNELSQDTKPEPKSLTLRRLSHCCFLPVIYCAVHDSYFCY